MAKSCQKNAGVSVVIIGLTTANQSSKANDGEECILCTKHLSISPAHAKHLDKATEAALK